MKKHLSKLSLIGLLLFFALALVYMSFFSGKETRVFVIPHQDDEVLSFGVPISESIREGHDVHLILLTDGSKTIARQMLDGEIFCTWHETYHDPVSEGFHFGGESTKELTPEMITQLRQIEYENSLTAFGIKENNIHYAHPTLRDGEVKADEVEEILTTLVEGKRKVHLFAFHPSALEAFRHKDHLASGRGADQVAIKNNLPITFFIEPYVREHFSEVDYNIIERAADGKSKLAIEGSIAAYKLYNPSEESYGIGYHSVKPHMDDFLDHATNYQIPK